MPPPDARLGSVSLVGAGPGAADLLTIRALRAIEGAQALLFDALVGEEILALAPAHCMKIQTGKRAGRASMAQATINRLMLRLARRGLRVVRLKGGDPSIFGRVGEEALFLRGRGLDPEIIPGVTAASAAAAEFGFPLTHRGLARRVVFATARLQAGRLQLDWKAAADPEATLAVYMGGGAMSELGRALIELGRAPDTPVAVVAGASRPGSQCQIGRLGELGDDPVRGDAPVLVIIGHALRFAARPRAAGDAPNPSDTNVLPRARAPEGRQEEHERAGCNDQMRTF